MSLCQKALVLIAGILVLVFAVGLGVRDLVLNPRLLALEQERDQKALRQFENSLAQQPQMLANNLQGIRTIAALLEQVMQHSDWQQVSRFLESADTRGMVDYLLISDDSGKLRHLALNKQLRPAALSEMSMRQLAFHAGQRLDKQKEDVVAGMAGSADGPLFYSATRTAESTVGPITFVLVRKAENDLPHLLAILELDAALLAKDVFFEAVAQSGAPLGERTADDRLFWMIEGDDGQPLLYLRAALSPRSFDDSHFSPTIISAFVASALLWLGVIALFRKRVCTPIRRFAETLQHIREDNDYTRRLYHSSSDELGMLVGECNRLLEHVENHTQVLEEYSFRDPLTQLGNRRFLTEQLRTAWSICRRQQVELAVACFDLDYFKQYNETYGHEAGDRILQLFGELLQKTFVRATDVLCRVGGEKFVVVLLNTSAENAELMAQRVINGLSAKHVPHIGSQIADHLTVSAGAAAVVPEELMASEDLMARANHALNQAKVGGRNRVVRAAALTH